jgi:hypothetical protein
MCAPSRLSPISASVAQTPNRDSRGYVVKQKYSTEEKTSINYMHAHTGYHRSVEEEQGRKRRIRRVMGPRVGQLKE